MIAAAAGRPARQLDGALDGLRARVAEEHRVERRRHGRGDRVGELRHRLEVAEPVADVPELVDLGVGGRLHARVAVAEHRDRDAAGEVEVLLAVGVPERWPSPRAQLRWK